MSVRAFNLRGLAFRRLDDEAVLERAREGQEAAFAELYHRFHGLVYGYCLARLLDPSAAEDVAQDTFLRINRSRSGERVHSARAWIFTVARSAVVDHVRSQKRLPDAIAVDEEYETATTGVDASDTMMRRDDARLVFFALARLKPRYRIALILREMHGLTSVEIGEALRLKPGAVDTLVSRARDAFGRQYASLSDLSAVCRRAVEYIYREHGTGIDCAEKAWLSAHLEECPRCAREHGLASDPQRLSVLLPFMGIRPEGLTVLQRALEVFGAAPASAEATSLMAVKVTAAAMAVTMAVAPLSVRGPVKEASVPRRHEVVAVHQSDAPAGHPGAAGAVSPSGAVGATGAPLRATVATTPPSALSSALSSAEATLVAAEARVAGTGAVTVAPAPVAEVIASGSEEPSGTADDGTPEPVDGVVADEGSSPGLVVPDGTTTTPAP